MEELISGQVGIQIGMQSPFNFNVFVPGGYVTSFGRLSSTANPDQVAYDLGSHLQLREDSDASGSKTEELVSGQVGRNISTQSPFKLNQREGIQKTMAVGSENPKCKYCLL